MSDYIRIKVAYANLSFEGQDIIKRVLHVAKALPEKEASEVLTVLSAVAQVGIDKREDLFLDSKLGRLSNSF